MSGLPPRLENPGLSEREAYAALVGAWQLVRSTIYHPDGTETYPYGRDGIGQIAYSGDGHMSCHLMRGDRPRFGLPSVYQVGEAELGRSMRDYSGYFGRFSIDAKAGIVTHHVIGAWYPDWIGIDQPRRYAFAGDRLFLEAEVGEDLVRIEWQRVVTDYAKAMGGAGH